MLDQISPIASSFGVLLVGWFLARHKPHVATIVTRIFLAALAAIMILLALTGMQHATLGEVHRWSGHGFTIVIWLWFVFMLGVVWGLRWPRRYLAAIGLSAVLLVCVSVGFLASITGFLGPSHRENPTQEELNRFVVLHQYTVPFLLTLSVAVIGWWEARSSQHSS